MDNKERLKNKESKEEAGTPLLPFLELSAFQNEFPSEHQLQRTCYSSKQCSVPRLLASQEMSSFEFSDVLFPCIGSERGRAAPELGNSLPT